MNKLIVLISLVFLLSECSDNLELDNAFDGGTTACGDFAAMKFSDDNSIGICIYGDSSALNLTDSAQIFSLDTMSDIMVVVDEFKQDRGWFSCTIWDNNYMYKTHRWEATSGTVSISASDATNPAFDYMVNINLTDVTFKHENKDIEVTLNSLELSDVNVE